MLKRLKQVYRFPFGMFTYSLLLISLFGIVDSFLDVERTRVFAYIPLLSPAILASAYYVSLVFDKHVTAAEVTSRFYYAFFIIGLPLIFLEFLSTFLLYYYFSWRNLLSTNGWWEEGLAFMMIISLVIILFVQWLSVLFFSLIIVLPVLAVAKTNVLLQGSILLRIKNKDVQNKLVRIIFIGLSSFISGLILTSILGYFYDFTLFPVLLKQGQISLPLIGWFLGWGSLSFGILCFVVFFIMVGIHLKQVK